MTKARLKELKALKKEAKHLEEQIRDLPFQTGPYVGDTATDGKTGFPKVFVIQGYSTQKYDRLKVKLQKKLKDIQEEVEEMEKWLDNIKDSQIRDILRLQYIDGLTQERIAEELGYARETVSRKLKTFWKEQLYNK